MKRTRRIEIITYTRRVTFVDSDEASADTSPTVGPPSIGIVTDTQAMITAASTGENNGPSAGAAEAAERPPGRHESRLRDYLLRLRRLRTTTGK